MTKHLHHIKIMADGEHPVLTKVELDGKMLSGVVSLAFNASTRSCTLELVLMADIEVEGDVPTEIQVITPRDPISS